MGVDTWIILGIFAVLVIAGLDIYITERRCDKLREDIWEKFDRLEEAEHERQAKD